jgi:Cys-tRNA(Pro)/Cys-tRNA(Cys) deacylase
VVVSKKDHTPKTNAARLLDRAGVHYELREYPVDENDLSAVHVAEAVGLPPAQVFKTLVARGDRSGVLLACIPGNMELDLKALAAASGNKKTELAPLKDVLSLTGYVRGGVSPLGTRKLYPLYLDSSAENWPVISVSAGLRGLQMLLAPDDLARTASAERHPIARPAQNG